MKKLAFSAILLLCFLCLYSPCCLGQQKIRHLFFNSTDNITGLDFKVPASPQVFYTGQKANATIGEGIAHAENENGEILFWVNSSGVFDNDHELMPDSEGIYAHPSSTEIAICPFPGIPSRYYIFYNNQLCSGLYYSVVDMNHRKGRGNVVELNVPVSPGIDFAEGLEIIRIPCSKDYWLITNECGKGFRKFKIDQEGISGGEMFGIFTDDFSGRGELDYHQGKIGLAVTFKNEAHFVNFDPETGESSNNHLVEFPSLNGTYGLEFSPDGNKAYVTDISNRDIFGNPVGHNLFSVNFNTREIRSWKINNDHPDCPSQMEGLGHIELGKDGNLYITQINGCQIVVVENPGSEQPAFRKINVNTILSAGISDHIQTDFLDEGGFVDLSIMVDGDASICSGEEIMLYTREQMENHPFQWYKDGNPLPNEHSQQLRVKEPGKYHLTSSYQAECTTISNEIIVVDRSIPALELPEEYRSCKGESVLLAIDPGDYQVTWSNGETGSSIVVQEAGAYGFTVDNGYCTSSGSVEVVLQEQSQLKIPNVITPNGDGYNEYFIISGAEEKIALSVYNRWGKLLFHAPDYQNNWNGKELPKGTYYYKIDPYSNCSEQKKGWLMIL